MDLICTSSFYPLSSIKRGNTFFSRTLWIKLVPLKTEFHLKTSGQLITEPFKYYFADFTLQFTKKFRQIFFPQMGEGGTPKFCIKKFRDFWLKNNTIFSPFYLFLDLWVHFKAFWSVFILVQTPLLALSGDFFPGSNLRTFRKWVSKSFYYETIFS